jgi:biopolymer transport protein TolQ
MTVDTGALHSILQASPIVQLILLVLLILSVLCWGVAYNKYQELKVLRAANEKFLASFWKAESLESLFEDLPHFAKSNLSRVFKAGYLEMKRLAESPINREKSANSLLSLSGADNLERVLLKSTDNELLSLESHLTLLATTGSTGPFIGLFGTVWGIMGSFQKIGATGSASLAVVAPGISEALITTAIGLAAAIPAVVLYNHFVAKVRKEEMELRNFSADFLNIAKRTFFTEK